MKRQGKQHVAPPPAPATALARRSYNTWNSKMDADAILTLTLFEQINEGNKGDGDFKQQVYQAVADKLRTELNMSLTAANVKNRIKSWKKHYSVITEIRTYTKFRWDEERKMLVIPVEELEEWKNYCKNNSSASAYQNKCIDNWDDNCTLFASDRATGDGAEQHEESTFAMEMENEVGSGSDTTDQDLVFRHKMRSESSGNEERKKVALDALQRRFAQAEDELLEQQQPKRKRALPQHKPQLTTYNSINNNNKVDTNSSLHQKPITTLSSPNPSLKKDTETNDRVYSLLSHPVHENLVSANVEISDRKGSVPDMILHELLRNGDAAQKYNQGSKSKKIDNWILFDNVDKGSGTYDRARIKALNKNSKRSKMHMCMKQHKKFGSLTLPDDSRNFEIYKPMHEMWKGYITLLLKNVGNNQLAQRLLSADLHGAIVLVVQSKIVSLIGASGIMIRETAETFSVISTDNKLHVVPKKASVFMLQADCWKITLLGDELRSRNMEP